MSRVMEFWPRAAVLSYVPIGYMYAHYTRSFEVVEFREVVVQVDCNAPIAFDGGYSCIDVIAQTSNDMQEWENVTDGTFNGIFIGSSYPFVESRKLVEFGRYMRMAICLISFEGGSTPFVGGTIQITGVGRKRGDE